MILLTCIMIGVIFAASAYLLMSRGLTEICMGIFLLGHGANLTIIIASGSPVSKIPPVLGQGIEISRFVDPLPQALILTAIVIGLAIQAFLLVLLVVTWRSQKTLDVDALGDTGENHP